MLFQLVITVMMNFCEDFTWVQYGILSVIDSIYFHVHVVHGKQRQPGKAMRKAIARGC